MVDEEAQRIRDEVIRAMIDQGEDVEALGFEVPAAPAEGEASIPLPEWGGVVEAAAGMRVADDAADMSEEDVERLFLVTVFDDVRAQSANGQLVQPADWLEAGLVPAHFAADDWEMFVYEYLEERASKRAAVEVADPKVPIRTATRTVGVPRMLRADEPEAPAPEVPRTEALNPEVPEAEPEPASEADPTLEPQPAASVECALPEAPEKPLCDDIVALTGKHSYYLYSTDHMTDAYARWAFLAGEDDRVLTFVECVRDESKKYPRPMEASSLSNEPFNLSAEEIEELWQAVRDGGAYPDLETLTASNGDVYYFSTEFLTPTYAASLAEWNSVERDMFL